MIGRREAPAIIEHSITIVRLLRIIRSQPTPYVDEKSVHSAYICCLEYQIPLFEVKREGQTHTGLPTLGCRKHQCRRREEWNEN